MPKPKFDPLTNENVRIILIKINKGDNYCSLIAREMGHTEVNIIKYLQKLLLRKFVYTIKDKKDHNKTLYFLTALGFKVLCMIKKRQLLLEELNVLRHKYDKMEENK